MNNPIYTIAIISLYLLQLPVLAQGTDSQAKYEIVYQFSGKVENKTDSVYQGYLMIEDKEILKTDRLYIKVGSTPGTSDLFKLAVYEKVLKKKRYDSTKDEEARLTREGDLVRIYLGEFTDRNHFLEVNFKDKEGKYKVAKDKHKTDQDNSLRTN